MPLIERACYSGIRVVLNPTIVSLRWVTQVMTLNQPRSVATTRWPSGKAWRRFGMKPSVGVGEM